MTFIVKRTDTPRRQSGRWRLALLATLVFVVSQANLVRLIGPLEPNIVVLQTRFTAEAFWSVLQAWGPEGLARYRAHLPYDWLHPFLYGVMGWLWVRRTPLFTRWPARRSRALSWSLPLAAVCDLLENALHVALLARPPGGSALFVALAGTASSLKWFLAVAFVVALAAAGTTWLWRRGQGEA